MDDKAKTSPRDAQRVDLSEDYECRYWMEKFSVTREDLERAINKVGPMAKDVERELKAA